MKVIVITVFICIAVMIGGCAFIDEKIYEAFAENAVKGKALATIKISRMQYAVLVCTDKKELHLIYLNENGITTLSPRIEKDEVISDTSCSYW